MASNGTARGYLTVLAVRHEDTGIPDGRDIWLVES